MFEQQAGENKFAKLALNAWDHSITKENEVEDLKVRAVATLCARCASTGRPPPTRIFAPPPSPLQFAIAEQFVVALHEEDLVQAKGRRSLQTRVRPHSLARSSHTHPAASLRTS